MKTRLAASVVAAAVVAVVLAGCNFITPQATLKPYDASDGVSTVVGDVHVLNALVLSEDGESGNLLFGALNTGDDDIDLTVQYVSDGERVSLELKVPADSTLDVGFGEGGQQFLTAIDTAPGGVLPIYFQYGAEEGKQLMVPVLDGSLEQYAPFLPQTPTPTPTPTETGVPTPDPTEDAEG